MEWNNICAIVPCNFGHHAGDGMSTRKHHLKEIHPALQANPGSTQMTYILQGLKTEVNRCHFVIIP